VNQILSAATRQRDLVKQILSFSRRGDRRFTPIQLGPLISETVAFIRSSLPSTIEITQRIDAAHDRILGDPTQIQQVVVNLCQNAVDALESQKGVVEISLENTRLERTESHPEIKEGEYLKLSVRDYGRGMSPEIVSRIFEPFYTTKEVGKGAGMGLPVIHGIIRSHGGMITVESEPGKGSIFTAYFPVTGRQPKVRKLPVKGAPQVHGRILLVDDELIVLSSVSKALKHLGYEVTAVEDSGEAFAVFSRSPGEFDLVITDLTMPGMSGIELAEKIKELSPDVPVILCTGFNDIIDEQEAREKGITGLIFKPAGTRDLGAAVGQALESR
jgi:CheY-like chemotaxis protein/anti-sigma regulatory factor (Ser/Thr protein kinase)